MKVSEVKKMICPINSKPCIANQCPKWNYTKLTTSIKIIPEVSCYCGYITIPNMLCPRCDELAIEKYKNRGIKSGEISLEGDDREGECTL